MAQTTVPSAMFDEGPNWKLAFLQSIFNLNAKPTSGKHHTKIQLVSSLNYSTNINKWLWWKQEQNIEHRKTTNK